MKRVILGIFIFSGVLLVTSCGGEEIPECVGVAVGDIRDDVNCDDCCKSNGYKRGIVETTTRGGSSSYVCRCSGDGD